MEKANLDAKLPFSISNFSFKQNLNAASEKPAFQSNCKNNSKTKNEDKNVSLAIDENNKSVNKEKVSKAKENIEKSFADLEEKQKTWSKDNDSDFCAVNNQFSRQNKIVETLKELNKCEMEALIDEYGIEDFAKKVLEPLLWQAGPDTDKDFLKALRHMLDYEIDESYRNKLREKDKGYDNQLKIAKEMNDRENVAEKENIVYWL